MLLPSVAIVGRPNVGKSSLFNRLVGRPIAIVDRYAGVTRDRVLHEVDRDGYRFDLVDTGGIGIVDEDQLEADVEQQIDRAIGTADRIIFLVDGRDGLVPLDEHIAGLLRPHKDHVILAVNKLDHMNLDEQKWEFTKLGFNEPLAISVEQRRGLDELLEAVGDGLPSAEDLAEADSAADDEGRLRIAFVGRRNVGKSSLTNALLGESRVIVSAHAGTTRDAIDVKLDHETGRFLLIDTAGLRKKKQLTKDLEFYAATRTERAIRRARIVFLVLDAGDELGEIDKKLANYCAASGRPTIIVINKWDVAQAAGANRDDYLTWLHDRLPWLDYAPVCFTCALTGAHVHDLLRIAVDLEAESHTRIPTAELNKHLEQAVQRRRPRKVGQGETRIYYGTQAEASPPTFVIFVNRADWIEPGYRRYLENYFRSRLPIGRVPVTIVFKARTSKFHDNKDVSPRTVARTKAERPSGLILPGGRPKRRRR